MTQFIVLGTHNSFGSFFVALLQEFHRSEAETGTIMNNHIFPHFHRAVHDKKIDFVDRLLRQGLASFLFSLFMVKFCRNQRKIQTEMKEIKSRKINSQPLRSKRERQIT